MLTEDNNNAAYQIQSYNNHEITINGTTYPESLIISTKKLVTNWTQNVATSLQPNDLMAFLSLSPEIILIGTGKKSIILSPEILAPLIERHYNVECMSTEAACRTYAVLSAEGRNVAAGLIIENRQ